MNPSLPPLLAALALVLAGCSKPAGDTPVPPVAAGTATNSPAPAPSTPAPAATVTQASSAPVPVPAPPLAPAVAPAPTPVASSPLTALVDQFVSSARKTGDAQLTSLSSDLGAKVQALADTVVPGTAVTDQLSGAMQSLLSPQGVETLATLNQLTKASLTPAQTKLAKDVWNLGSAYLVQRELGSLSGSRPEIATIVSSLRQGEVTPALPAIQKVLQEVQLTAPQKDLLGSLARQYVPALKDAGDKFDALKKSVPGLGQ